MTPRLLLRELVPADLDRVAALHRDAFPDSVLGRLGAEAVRRNYVWQLTGPHDVTALVAAQDDRVVGFLFGGVFRGSTVGFVKREKWFLLRQVLAHPRILLRGVSWDRFRTATRLLARRSPPSSGVSTTPSVRSFGVLAIAVDPATQGTGVGAALMGEARRRAEALGFERMHLSVRPDNERARGFYRSLGWIESPEPDGTWVGRMVCRLAPSGP